MSETVKGTTAQKIEDYKRKKEHIQQMGGPEAIEKRHKKGQLSARERIDYFFD